MYIKHVSNKDKELIQLIKELNKSGVSFYYYKDNNDLLKRMKGTIFTIAKEIAISQVNKLKFSRKDILKHSISHDYSEAMNIIKLVESLKRNINLINIFDTTIFFDLLDRLTLIYEYDKEIFVENRLNNCFKNIIVEYNKAEKLHTNIYTSKVGQRQKIYFESIDEEVTFSQLEFHGKDNDKQQVKKNFDDFFSVYEEFKKLVLNLKGEVDSL